MAKQEQKKDFRYLIRLVNTDIDGKKSLLYGLKRIKGISYMLANAICETAGLDKNQKVGSLNEDQIKKLEATIKSIGQKGLPSWLLNRRRDPESGEDRHLLSTDLSFVQSNDIKKMMKMKSYKGTRHPLKLPLRGQRTKSNFRKSKGKGSLGVQRKKKK